jgi:hypothetical protein
MMNIMSGFPSPKISNLQAPNIIQSGKFAHEATAIIHVDCCEGTFIGRVFVKCK